MSGYPYGHSPWPPPPQPPQPQPQYQQPPAQQQPPYAQPYQQPFQQPYGRFPPYDYNAVSNPSPAFGMNAYQMPPQAPVQMPPQIPPVPDYYASSQTAFDYNASRNAGLGISVPPSVHGTPDVMAGRPGWGQTPTVAAASPSHYSPYVPPPHVSPAPEKTEIPASGSFQELFQPHRAQDDPQPAYQPPPPRPEPTASRPSPPSPPKDKASSREDGELEEGELSDSDELYNSRGASSSAPTGDAPASNPTQPKETTSDAANPLLDPPSVLPGAPATDIPSRDASVIDLQEDTFYDEDEEPGEAKSNDNGVSASDAADADDEDMGFSDSEQRATSVDQQRMPSYSPHLSPREVESDKKDVPNQTTGDASQAAPVEASTEKQAETATSSKSPAADKTANGQVDDSDSTRETSPSTKLPFATMEEAKREAQRAILGLISYGVNYQTYIDEGFDDKVIKTLFTELGLKSTPPATEPSPKPTTAPSVLPKAAGTSASGSTSKQEERKDRIARLLALKASKPATAVPPPRPAEPVSSTIQETQEAPNPAPEAPRALPTGQQAKPEKTKSEKERLLQQKLDALRRTQEQRATAAAVPAQKPAGAGSESAAQNAQAPVERPAGNGAPRADVQHKPGPVPLLASANLSPPSAPAAAAPRKRPVAADFDDFSAPSNPLKRPFGNMRQDSSLVIDVSDDSDDDVEMEVESQTDEVPSRGLQDNKPPRSSTSFRNFPPLSGPPHQPRQFGGRTPSSMPTPPSGPASSKAADDQYARKLRQIEEMKRKIAEAEAKKARSSPTGSQTPKTGGSSSPAEAESTPKFPMRRAVSTGDMLKDMGGASGAAAEDAASKSFVEAVSERLPKRSDTSSTSSRESRRESRARIASHQLPRVEASLQEKMFKLRLFQEKIASLQAEIDAGMAEKKRLTLEMDELDKESPTHTPQPQPTPPAHEPSAPEAAAADDVTAETAHQPLHTPPLGEEEEAHQATSASAEEAPDVAMESDTEACAAVGDAAPSSSEVATHAIAESRADSDIPEADSRAESDDNADNTDNTDNADNVSVTSKADDHVEASPQPSELSEAASSHEPAAEPADDDDDSDIVMEDEAAAVDEPSAEEMSLSQPVAEQAASSEVGIVSLPPATHDRGRTPLTKPCLQSQSQTKAATSSLALTPYESPLKYFRSYRFHPQYKNNVKGGLKSLTYSGRIEPDTELCPSELEDQTCQDPSCRFQHFASIVPQDDQILVELGRSDDFTGEQKARFVTGLRDVLKRFRDAKVRDFDTIAYEIIDFRRRFLGDDSKVVSHLEDVTI